MPVQRQLRKRHSFRSQIMNRLTREGGSPQEWDEILTPTIMAGFREELTLAEAQHWPEVASFLLHFDAHGNIAAFSKNYAVEYMALVNKFDEYIPYVASSVGVRVVFSAPVFRRMVAWEAKEPDGPERLSRLGKALEHAALILQKAIPPSVTDPEWHAFRKETIQELKPFFRQLLHFARARYRRLSTAELCDWVASQLAAQPEAFGHLRRNLGPLLEYLQSKDSSFAIRLKGGEKVAAAEFFDVWMGWRMRLSPEKFRQRISLIGSSPRKAQQ